MAEKIERREVSPEEMPSWIRKKLHIKIYSINNGLEYLLSSVFIVAIVYFFFQNAAYYVYMLAYIASFDEIKNNKNMKYKAIYTIISTIIAILYSIKTFL